jgi:chitin synthase
LTDLLQGLLLAGILGGGQSVDTFKPGGGITAAKAYMTFVLAFVGLTSIIVSSDIFSRRPP